MDTIGGSSDCHVVGARVYSERNRLIFVGYIVFYQ